MEPTRLGPRSFADKARFRLTRIHSGVAKLLLLSTVMFILSSCGGSGIQEPNRIKWSPDGKRALVFCREGVRVADLSGKLSRVISDQGSGNRNLAVWMPDSEHLIIVVAEEITGWKELKEFIPKSEQTRIEDAAKLYLRLVASGKSYSTLSEEEQAVWQKATKDLNISDVEVYLFSKNRQNEVDRFKGLPSDTHAVALSRIKALRLFRVLPNNSVEQEGNSFYRTRWYIDALSVSGSGFAVAGVEARHSFDSNDRIFVVSIPPNNSDSVLLPYSVSPSLGWCPDQERLLFIEEGDSVFSLSVVNILSSDGHLCKKPKIKKLVSLPGYSTGLHCTTDGVVYIACHESVAGLPNGPQKLFKITLGSPVLERIIPDKFFSQDSFEYFSMSPDSRHIAIVKDGGTVDVFDTANGAIVEAQNSPFSPSQADQSVFIPNWRTSDQLCFSAPSSGAPGDRAASIRLWSLSDRTSQDFSSGWPPDSAGFLDRVVERDD